MSTYGSSKGPALSLGTLSNVALVGALVALTSVTFYYSVVAYNYQGTQDIRAYYLEQNVINNVTNLEQSVINNITSINQTFTTDIDTITNEIAVIQLQLNITEGSGDVLEGRVTALEESRLRTINGVSGDVSMKNINFIGSNGISITPNPGSNQITVQNNGVTSVSSASSSISVNQAIGAITITDNGVTSLASASSSISINQSTGAITITDNGVTSLASASSSISISQSTGAITITDNGVTSVNGFTQSVLIDATDGITISSNASHVLVTAPIITTAITNLQMEDATQGMQIAALQAENANQQMMIDMIKSAGESIGDMINSTDIDLSMFNMTLMELLVDVAMLKQQVADLEQNQGANASSIPTGTIVPFGGGMVPDGYLECNGAEYPTTGTYENLFNVIGTVFCPSMTCTMGNFAVPDLRGRVPVGLGGGGAFTTLGDQTQGSETVTLTHDQMPAHNHGGLALGDGDHNHSGSVGDGGNHNHGGTTIGTVTAGFNPGFPTNLGYDSGADVQVFPDPGGSTNINIVNDQDHQHTISSTGTTHGHPIPDSGTHTHVIPVSGVGDPHSNVQPSTVVNYMIKT